MARSPTESRVRDALIAAAAGPIVVLGGTVVTDDQGPATPVVIAAVIAGLCIVTLASFAILRLAPRRGVLGIWVLLSLLILWPIVQFARTPHLHVRQATHLLASFLYWSMWAAIPFVTAAVYRWRTRTPSQWAMFCFFGAVWLVSLWFARANTIAFDVGVPPAPAYTTVGAVSLVISLGCPLLGAAWLARDVDPVSAI